MRKLFWFIAITVIVQAAVALADDVVTCTTEPRSKWISEAEMKDRIAGMGYTFDVFKMSRGGCYEIYGRDSSGKRVEVYFDPITGDVAKASK